MAGVNGVTLTPFTPPRFTPEFTPRFTPATPEVTLEKWRSIFHIQTVRRTMKSVKDLSALIVPTKTTRNRPRGWQAPPKFLGTVAPQPHVREKPLHLEGDQLTLI